MAATLTSTGRVDSLLVAYLQRELIERLVPEAQFYKQAKKYSLPKNAGATQMRFNQWARLAVPSGALTEGTNPDAAGLTARSVAVTIAEYGRAVRITGLADDSILSSHLDDALSNIADCARDTVEEVIMLGIFKGTLSQNLGTKILSALMSAVASAFCAVTGTAPAAVGTVGQFQFPVIIAGSATRLSASKAGNNGATVSAKISLHAIRKVVVSLRRQNAKPQANGSYIGIAHPNALATLQRDQSWVEWNQPQMVRETMMRGFVGSAGGVDFVSTTKCPRYAVTANSVNLTFIFSPGAYGAVALGEGDAVQMYVVRPNAYDSGNALQMHSTLGFKLRLVSVALNPSAGRLLLSKEDAS